MWTKDLSFLPENALNIQRLQDSIESIEEYCRQRRIGLDSKEKAQVVALIYDAFSRFEHLSVSPRKRWGASFGARTPSADPTPQRAERKHGLKVSLYYIKDNCVQSAFGGRGDGGSIRPLLARFAARAFSAGQEANHPLSIEFSKKESAISTFERGSVHAHVGVRD